MSGLARRLSIAERSVSSARLNPPAWHQFILEPGETLESAIDAFGRDRIGPDDGIIAHQIVDVGDDLRAGQMASNLVGAK